MTSSFVIRSDTRSPREDFAANGARKYMRRKIVVLVDAQIYHLPAFLRKNFHLIRSTVTILKSSNGNNRPSIAYLNRKRSFVGISKT